MDTTEFFARLVAVNWVEREHKKRTAVAAQAEPLFTEVCLAIKNSVESFNRLYRASPLEPVQYTPMARAMTVSLLLPLRGIPGTVEQRRHVRVLIGQTEANDRIHCVFENCQIDLKPVAILFQLGDDGKVFLEHEGKKLADADAASEAILAKFFRNLEKL